MGDTPVSTIVTINGTPFDIKDMTAEKGAELYTALGQTKTSTDYQAIAKSFSSFMMNYQSIISIKMDKGVSITDAAKELFEILHKEGAKGLANAKPYLQELAKVPGISTLVATTNTTTDITYFMKEFMDGIKFDPRNIGDRFVTAAKDSVVEFGNQLDSRFAHISQAQADAIGAAYAASIYVAKDGPLPEGAKDLREPDFFDKAFTRGETLFAHIGKFLKEHVPFLPAAVKYVFKGFKDWDACLAEAKKEGNEEVTPYEERLAKKMSSKANDRARPIAADMLKEAHEIAGVSTTKVSEMITNQNAYRDEKGNVNSLTFDGDGKAVITPIKDDKGEQVRADNKSTQSWNAAMSPAYIAGTVMSVDGVKGMVRGASSSVVGKNSKLVVKGTELLNESQLMKQDAALAAEGKLPKTTFGIKNGFHPASEEMSKKLLQEAAEKETQGNLLLTRAKGRVDFLKTNKLGSWVVRQAEAEAPQGTLRFMNKIGAGEGKLLSGPINGIVNTVEGTSISSAKGFAKLIPGEGTTGAIKGGTYIVDGFQTFEAWKNGDSHGVYENLMQASAGYAGGNLTESLAVEFLPGRFKILAPVIGLFGFAGGHKLGEITTNAILPKTSDEKALAELNTLTTASTERLQQLQKEGKVANDDEVIAILAKYNEENKNNPNAVVTGVNNSTLQVAGRK